MLAAYDHCLKCSHLFNVLDSRGVISVTERATLIGRVRQLACGTAAAYLEQRLGVVADQRGDGMKAGAPLLFEIGCEEIPAGMLPGAAQQLKVLLEKYLSAEKSFLAKRRWTYSASPRRLTAMLQQLCG